MEKHVVNCGASVYVDTNANVNTNAASGTLHEPIGVNPNMNAIEKPGTLTFYRKFREKKTCHVLHSHTTYVES